MDADIRINGETHQDGFAKADDMEIETNDGNVNKNEEQEKNQNLKQYLESLYHDLDNIILDANQNQTGPNLSLNNGLLLYKIKSLNEMLENKNQFIQVNISLIVLYEM